MPKGLSPVIAVILLLLIVIAIVAFSFGFFQRIASSASASGEEQLQQTAKLTSSQFRIESAGNDRLYIRNTGEEDIVKDSVEVYLNNKKVTYTMASGIGEGAVGEISGLPFAVSDSGQEAILKVSGASISSQQTVRAVTKSCKDILDYELSKGNGIYIIKPADAEFDVYCDMTTDGGGWTLSMKSLNDNSDFYYLSSHWTTGTTLNPNDFELGSTTNSKYESFNTVKFKEIMLVSVDTGTKKKFTLAGALQNKFTLLDLAGASHDKNTEETIENDYVGIYYGNSYLFPNININGHEHHICHKLAFSGDHYSSNINDHGVARIGYVMSQEYPCGHPGTAEGFGLMQVSSGTHRKGSGRVQWDTESDYFARGLIYVR